MSISIKVDLNTLKFLLNESYNKSKQIHNEYKKCKKVKIPK